jgi:hypothetical protein
LPSSRPIRLPAIQLQQYPARTLNQIVLPLQSTIHYRNYSCSPRREVQLALLPSTTLITISTTRTAPGHSSLILLARSLVSPVTTALVKETNSRVACSEPTTAMRAETVAVPVQHTIDALVADQPLKRFQSPGWCPALSSAA